MASHPHIFGPGLVERRLRVADSDVVWLRALLEAYDGLGYLFGDGSGIVSLTTTTSQAAALDAFVAQLGEEAAVEPVDAALTDDPTPR